MRNTKYALRLKFFPFFITQLFLLESIYILANIGLLRIRLEAISDIFNIFRKSQMQEKASVCVGIPTQEVETAGQLSNQLKKDLMDLNH